MPTGIRAAISSELVHRDNDLDRPDVLRNPFAKLFLGETACGKRSDRRYHFNIRRREIKTVDSEKRYHGEESDALVPVDVGMTLHKCEAIRRRQFRRIAFLPIGPFIPRTR